MVNKMNIGYYDSPVGMLEIAEEHNAIKYIKYMNSNADKETNYTDYIRKIIAQLEEYFCGGRKVFDLKLNPEGTDFQSDVWKELLKIPFGKNKTYQQIADDIGDPGAARAVGNANNKNPIAIVIPCHRVVGASGNLTGYAGGLSKKDWLLKHELKYSDAEMQLDLF